MTRIVVFAISLQALSSLGFAQTTTDTAKAVPTTTAEQEVLRVLADLRTAILKQDAAAIEALISDTYLAVRVDGTFNNKPGLLKNNQSGAVKYDVYEDLGGASVRIHDDTAVVVSNVRTAGRNQNGQFNETRRVTSVLVKRQGRWRVIAAHMGRVP
jgi:ketosteroid isomerase-like protein